MNEFNQCQTQLKELYVELNGSLKENDSANEHANIVEKEANEEQASDNLVWMDEPPAVVGHPTEFLGYRLLYYVITNSQAALQVRMYSLCVLIFSVFIFVCCS